jgi:hypothetical protein
MLQFALQPWDDRQETHACCDVSNWAPRGSFSDASLYITRERKGEEKEEGRGEKRGKRKR